MILIKKLTRPLRTSGYPIKPGQTTKVRGVTIINTTSSVLHIDRYTPNVPKRKRKARGAK